MNIQEAKQITVGDLVDIAAGPYAGNNAIVLQIELTANTYCPASGWHGGPAIRFGTDIGTVHHFNVGAIRHKGWLLGN